MDQVARGSHRPLVRALPEYALPACTIREEFRVEERVQVRLLKEEL
jgi:hypothetical protein